MDSMDSLILAQVVGQSAAWLGGTIGIFGKTWEEAPIPQDDSKSWRIYQVIKTIKLTKKGWFAVVFLAGGLLTSGIATFTFQSSIRQLMMANAKQVQETLDEARRLNVELTQTREIVKEINGSVPQLNKAIENSTKSTRGRLDEVNNSLKTQNDSAQKELSKGLEDLTTAQAGTKKDLLKEVDNAKTSLITDYTGKFKIVNDSLNRMSLDARTTKEDLTGRLGSTKEQLDRNKADTDKIKMDLASAIAEISRFKGQFETTQKTLADLQRDVKNHGQALTKFAKDDLGPLISSISTLTDKVNQLVKASVTPQPPKSAGP